jgi:hypothetical protein
MTDVTVASFDEMEPIYDGLARRARATLGVTSFGTQVFTLPPNWDGYPNHDHGDSAIDPNQVEVYIPVEGSARCTTRTTHCRRRCCAPGAAWIASSLVRPLAPGSTG